MSLEAVGSAADAFALMMHDRLLALERDVAALLPKPLDPAVTILGTKTRSDLGGVFVRARCTQPVDLDVWARETMRRITVVDPARIDMWCCQHWTTGYGTSGPTYMAEALVERWYTPRGMCVSAAAHAALDALRAAGHEGVALDACAVTNSRWFSESIRAAADGGAGVLRTWDPDAERMVTSPMASESSSANESKAWTMLHGWLAMHTEVTDVWHPRAHSAASAGIQLLAAIARLVDA